MRNKFLFFIPSPRDIPEVKQPIVDLLYQKHDVLWMKYYPELEAYQKARQYFLNSPKKYDYLCIIPDDLAINSEGLNNLFRELENPSIELSKFGGNYPVLAGVCNYSYINEQQMEMVAASISSTVSSYLLTFKGLESMKDNIIKCAYIGFSCEFIHRDVLKQIDFKRYPDLGLDNAFSDQLIKKKIPQYILKTAKFVHYKGLSVKYRTALSTNPDIIFSGIKKPYVLFVDSDVKPE
jgi:GT2 family glycosyltransferase